MMIKIIDNQATCKNIKNMLEERGITPRMVQEALELESVQAVYKWYKTAEGGRVNSIPSIDNLVLLGVLMGVKVDDLLSLRNVDINRGDTK